jgi:hypothetical protein
MLLEAPDLKVWIGHYKGNPKEWFVAWAKTKDEVFLQIDPIVAEPDMNSLKELHAPGFVNFTLDCKEEEAIGFLPPKEDVEGGYWLVFGGALGQDDNVQEYVLRFLPRRKVKKR